MYVLHFDTYRKASLWITVNSLKQNASETDIQQFLTDGEQVAFTVRIPKNLKGAATDVAGLRGMGFSAFVRNCMIQELSRKS